MAVGRVTAVMAVLVAAHATFSPPKNATSPLASLKADLNATKTALDTEVALMLGNATVDETLKPYVGTVTCYVDDATGDVVGLHFGFIPLLCSTAGTPRSFTVPDDGYISNVKVAVDKATGLVGEMTFVVKSTTSMIPTNVVTCGTRGGVGVDIMPKVADGLAGLSKPTALSSMTAACKPTRSGRRLQQADRGAAIDPARLKVAATTVNTRQVVRTCSSGRRLLQTGGCGNPWMGRMADALGNRTLSEVVLPGTHDSGTSGVDERGLASVAKTQTRTIGEQLADGIRYFDFRVRERQHYDCADSTVFSFYHGQAFGDNLGGPYIDSYMLIDGLEAIKQFCLNPVNAKEIIVLDFQHIELKYGDERATGVLLRTVQDYLGPYLLPYDEDAYRMLGQNAKTLSSIWKTNGDKNTRRQVLVLVERDRLNEGQGCGDPYDKKFFGVREDNLMSFYGEREFSSGIKDDIDAQLSRAAALSQTREDLFNAYRYKQEQRALTVLQLVPRPSDGWFFGSGAAKSDWLLNYADFINHSFNECPDGTSGWFGQRLWAGLTIRSANWTRPNIIIVDNYLAETRPTRFNVQDPPPSPVNWRSMAWNSWEERWVQTSMTDSYVDYVTSLNLVKQANSAAISKFSSNDNCYKY